MSGEKNETSTDKKLNPQQELEALIKKDCEERVIKFNEELIKLQEKYGIDLLASVSFTQNHKPEYKVIIAARVKQ